MNHSLYDHCTPLAGCVADMRALADQVACDRFTPPDCIHPVLRTLASLIYTTTDGAERIETFIPRLVGTSTNVYQSAPLLAMRAAIHFADATDSVMADCWRFVADQFDARDDNRSRWYMAATELLHVIADRANQPHVPPAALLGYQHAYNVIDIGSGFAATGRLDQSCYAAWQFGRAAIERAGCSPDTLLDHLATTQATILGTLRTVAPALLFDADAWAAAWPATV